MLSTLWASEPALVLASVGALAEAALVLAIALGVPISPEQKLALTGFGTIVITVLTGLVTRAHVVPLAKVVTMLPAVPAVPVPPVVVAPPA